ncbi:MAG: hypothetical protein HOQ21_10010 [Dermatophilaceae bacterium]|nr:hypothetical protein [Dermatophilaceae bacterium]
MNARTSSQRGAANRDKGARAERAVVSWLRENGFPGAERAVRTGYKSGNRTAIDPGDITGTPGLVWQITDRADADEPAVIERRMQETERQRIHANAAYGFFVVKRRGFADPGRWWVWMPADVIATLVNGHYIGKDIHFPVRTELAGVVTLVRRCGFGDLPDGVQT